MSASVDPKVLVAARRLLGVDRDATPQEINAAFRRRVRAMHPDLGGAGGDAAALVDARALCVDDALLRQTAQPRVAPRTAGAPTSDFRGFTPRSAHLRPKKGADAFKPLFGDQAPRFDQRV